MKKIMVFEEEDYKKLMDFLDAPLGTAKGGDTLTVPSVNGEGDIIAIKLKIKMVPEEEKPSTHIMFMYEHHVYCDAQKFKYPDHVGYACNYTDTFEFYSTPNKDRYKLEQAYGQIKSNMILVHGYSKKNKETIDELFRLIKDIEKEDLE